MKQLIDKIDAMVDEQTKNIEMEWPGYSSDHEAHSVLREEHEEVSVEFVRATNELQRLWDQVKQSKELLDPDIIASDTAWLFLAAEAVQCAAVCRKWRREKQGKEQK